MMAAPRRIFVMTACRALRRGLGEIAPFHHDRRAGRRSSFASLYYFGHSVVVMQPQRGFGHRIPPVTRSGALFERGRPAQRRARPRPGAAAQRPGLDRHADGHRGAVVGARDLSDPRRRDADRPDARGRPVGPRAQRPPRPVSVGMVAWETKGLVRARLAGAAAARLHGRVVGLFSLVATLPAILVALVASVTLERGLQPWFSEQMRDVIFKSVEVADAYATGQCQSLGARNPHPRRRPRASAAGPRCRPALVRRVHHFSGDRPRPAGDAHRQAAERNRGPGEYRRAEGSARPVPGNLRRGAELGRSDLRRAARGPGVRSRAASCRNTRARTSSSPAR